MYVDITGALHVKGTDGCSSVVHYSSFSIGFNTYYSVVDDKTTIDSLFFGEEEGETYTIVADSAQSDDIILFNQIAYNSDSLFEQMVGININIKNGGVRIAGNLNSYSVTITANNTSFEVFSSPQKTGITISQGVDYKNLSAEGYVQYYFRPFTCAGDIVACAACPVIATFFEYFFREQAFVY